MNTSHSLGALRRLWPGPRPYTEVQANDFFGRNSEIGAAHDRISGQRLTVIRAPSAAGKTSLLRAGIVPELRLARLEALEADGSPSGRPFPLLINQWLGRVGPERTIDFAKLLLLEVHRHLAECRSWYVAEVATSNDAPVYLKTLRDEIARIDDTRERLKDLGISKGFMALDRDGLVKPVVSRCLEKVNDEQITDLLLEIDGVLSAAFESVVLILDQFEEILGAAVLGRQAIVAVDAIYKQCPETIRQMISMRDDSCPFGSHA